MGWMSDSMKFRVERGHLLRRWSRSYWMIFGGGEEVMAVRDLELRRRVLRDEMGMGENRDA
jgi:hypothetical protein